MKIGVIGTSLISEWLIKSYKECNQTVLAIYSRSLEKGNKFAEKNGIERVYSRLEDLMSDADLEVIYIASPNSLHFDQAKMALNYGKNVIVEKPICSNEKELRELVDLAHEKKLMFFEAMTILHLPNYKEIKNHLDDISPVRIVEVNYSQYSSRYDLLLKNQMTNIFDTRFSGGTLMDINVYCISFIVGLFGKPKRATYYANKSHNIDTSGVGILEYDGFVATSIGSKDNNGKSFAQIQGEGGYIMVDSKPSRVASIELNIRNEFTEVIDYQDIENHYTYQINEFFKCFAEKDYDLCDYYMNKSLEIMGTLDMLRESAGIKFTADQK
jgi:predicted dehydrogenase